MQSSAFSFGKTQGVPARWGEPARGIPTPRPFPGRGSGGPGGGPGRKRGSQLQGAGGRGPGLTVVLRPVFFEHILTGASRNLKFKYLHSVNVLLYSALLCLLSLSLLLALSLPIELD